MQDSEIEATVKTADDMWVAYQTKHKDPIWIKKNATEKIGHFQTLGYGDFITKYAVPTRYMLIYGEYTHTAFQKYLIRLRTVGYHSKSDWIDRQADYVKMLWRAYNPRAGAKEAGDAWLQARDSVKKEMESFETDYEKAKLKAEERRKAAMEVQRATLIELLHDNTVTSLVADMINVHVVQEQKQESECEKEPEPKQNEECKEDKVHLTESQRRNAARRRKVKQARADELEIKQRRVEKDRAREERRKQRDLEKVLAREAEKERMRQRWAENQVEKPVEVEVEVLESASEIEDLPSE